MGALGWLAAFAAFVVMVLVMRAVWGRGDSSVRDGAEAAGGSCAGCDAGAGGCALQCLKEAAAGDIEYFDDEELDGFRGRRPDSYTDGETAMFAEVMHTMRPDEVGAWMISLRRRGISLPGGLRDEARALAAGNAQRRVKQ